MDNLTTRLRYYAPCESNSIEAANEIDRLIQETVDLREALITLHGSTRTMLDTCERNGVFADVIAELFPETKKFGKKASQKAFELERVRNETKAVLSQTKAILKIVEVSDA